MCRWSGGTIVDITTQEGGVLMEIYWAVLYGTLGYISAGLLVVGAILLTIFFCALCVGIWGLRIQKK
jgi:hypothetical protein